MGKLHSKHGKLFFFETMREISTEISRAAAITLLSSTSTHCLLVFLSLKRLFVNRGKAQKVSAIFMLAFFGRSLTFREVAL